MDITKFLQLMVDEEASDIFFSTHASVSMKVMGKIRPVSKQTLSSSQIESILSKLVDEEQLQEFHDTLELNFAISVSEVGRFRANAFRQRGDIAMVIRHIKTDIPTTEQMHLPSTLNDLVASKNGLIMVVGATGSGKSTTLAAMVGYRNSNIGGHILTIEDPVEFIHAHKKAIVNQREVGLDTLSYGNALKNAMREAPDVILIGEVRDAETMEHAMAYADTGHLCLTTLHASNAIQALDRIFNFFPKNAHRQLSEDLSRNLRAIISQRLIPGKDGNLYPAVEILINTPYVTEILQQSKLEKLPEAMEQGSKYGMATFDDVLYRMYKAGTIDVKTALEYADSYNNLQLKIRMSDGSAGDEVFTDIDF
ncbi:PilT/PilU family type 4a pilus ATPase [sulfur-oxidizing endosymbiont of Gigantopelta aegis]|uniref:PilT/PilU family type 4a pilus ATPase n=1 Tax=sulfur-oxidizing endosymbiont of Gigantopelta aegis TaxID=2794934 RepID=UPI0018DB4E3B|nr:PilT/PilU family type 4a pilus ATPase [sulfur-oxidizing endosymbiont of Gigantopelta aegis]